MLNFITTLKNNIAQLKDNVQHSNKEGWRSLLTASLFVVFLAIAILGVFPHRQFFWMKCWTAEWAILIFLGLVFLKDKWLKIFFLWCVFLWIKAIVHPGKIIVFISFYYIFLFLIVYQVLMDKLKKETLIIIINGLCVVILAQLVYMYFQLFNIDPIFKSMPTWPSNYNVPHFVQGFWGHTNISGASLAITLPLFFRRRWWVFVLPITVMLVFTYSLGAIIALGCGLVFFICFYLKKWKKSFFLLLILTSVCLYGLTLDKSQFNFQNDRVKLVKSTIPFIKKAPITGWNLGQYKFAYKTITKRKKGTHAHNEAIELIFEAGIPGILPLIGFLTMLSWMFFKNRTYLSLLLMSGLITGLVNSCSTFIFHTPLAWVLLFYMVAIKILTKREVSNGTEVHRT